MIVFRLCRKIYANDLSGRGSEISGGRWNSKGIAALYTSYSRALCTIEIVVHVPAGIIPKDYEMVSIELPDDAVAKTIQPKDLPGNWNNNPINAHTQRIGDAFLLERKALVLKVPSVMQHKDFYKVKILYKEPFAFDMRLFK